MGEGFPLLKQYETIFKHSPHMKVVLGYIYADLLEFHKRAIRFFSGGGEGSKSCLPCANVDLTALPFSVACGFPFGMERFWKPIQGHSREYAPS